MKLIDALRDLVRTISPMDFDTIEVLKEGDKVFFNAYTNDKVLIMRASTKEDIPELPVGKFGISNLKILQGLIDLKMYSSEETVITYDEEKTKLNFKSPEASTSFILQKPKFVPTQPRFNEQPYQISIDPSAAKLKELKDFSSVFSFSSTVTPYVEDETLNFFVGELNKNTHNGVIAFSKTEQSLKKSFSYNTTRIMQATARINNAKTKSMNIAEVGMMKIELDTGLMVYSFFITGQ